MKKVSEAEKRDRSAAAVPGGDTGSSNNAAGTTTGASSGADQGGLAGALASALAARKSKVSQSGMFSTPHCMSEGMTNEKQMTKTIKMIGETLRWLYINFVVAFSECMYTPGSRYW